MRILFVSAIFPYPLHSGGAVRVYNLLREAAKKHEITLYSFTREEPKKQRRKGLEFCKKVLTVNRGRAIQPKYLPRSVLGAYPLLLTSYDNRRLRAAIEAELQTQTYDHVHIEPFYVYPSLPTLTIPLVVAEHNIEYQVYQDHARTYPVPFARPLLRAQAIQIKRWEEDVWRKATQLIAVSEGDKNLIQTFLSSSNVSVVPNGVDLASFPYHRRHTDIHAPTFLFVGNFSWVPNQEAL